MLPKLQQSSLANTLRRDNLASQIQCTKHHIQARTNFVACSANRTMRATNHGKTNMLLKTRILPSATSPKSISLRRS